MCGAEEASAAAEKAGGRRRFTAPAAKDWREGGQASPCSLCSFAETRSAAGGADACGELGVWPGASGLAAWRVRCERSAGGAGQ